MFGSNICFCKVNYLQPSLSNTGQIKPESGLFAQFMDIGAFVFFLIVTARFYQLKYWIRYNRIIRTKIYSIIMNYISFVLGSLAAIGLTILGNFQVIQKIIRLDRIKHNTFM
jgi:hypothetical protein